VISTAKIACVPIVAVLATIGASPASAAQARVSAYFVQGEQLAAVTRQGSRPLDAVRQLIAGPTRGFPPRIRR